ncbi:MAG: MauE/DoxX family redox-associated membrane protein [Cyclobacteriaceae bacterium]
MKNKILLVLCVLFGLFFINAGLNKFFNYMPAPPDENMMKLMGAFATIGWIMPLVGAAEIIGGALIAIPKTRALGAIVVFPVIVGILLTNIVNIPTGLPIAVIFFAINAWVIYENREKYMPMIR